MGPHCITITLCGIRMLKTAVYPMVATHGADAVSRFGCTYKIYTAKLGRDSSVGIATRYGPDSPAIESRLGGEIFCTRPDLPWDPPSLLYNGYRVFHGGKAAGAWL